MFFLPPGPWVSQSHDKQTEQVSAGPSQTHPSIYVSPCRYACYKEQQCDNEWLVACLRLHTFKAQLCLASQKALVFCIYSLIREPHASFVVQLKAAILFMWAYFGEALWVSVLDLDMLEMNWPINQCDSFKLALRVGVKLLNIFFWSSASSSFFVFMKYSLN